MKIAILGVTGHWHSYVAALKTVPGAEVVGVCCSGPEENPREFDAAPGVSATTPRCATLPDLIERCKPDVVQICAQPDRLAAFSTVCLERGVAVFSEKPLALNIKELEALYAVARRTGTPIMPMHTMRGVAELLAVRTAIAAGAIGTPQLAFSQKSYRWGATRPDYFRTRATFPGIVPFVGIHAIDWTYWMLGDVFTHVHGTGGNTRPDFAGCGSQAGLVFMLKSGGAAVVALDYLRPAAAPTHGDDRVRIAGTLGVAEARVAEKFAGLITAQATTNLPTALSGDVCAEYFTALSKKAAPPIGLYDSFRITELALRAQEAVDLSSNVSLLSCFDK